MRYKDSNEAKVRWLNSWFEENEQCEYALVYAYGRVQLVIRSTVTNVVSTISPSMTNSQMNDTLSTLQNYITVAPGFKGVTI